MIRKNRRELNSYSPSKYIGCKKSQKELVRYYMHKLFLLMEGGLKLEKCTELGKTLTMSMLDWFFSAEKEGESRNLFQGLYQVYSINSAFVISKQLLSRVCRHYTKYFFA